MIRVQTQVTAIFKALGIDHQVTFLYNSETGVVHTEHIEFTNGEAKVMLLDSDPNGRKDFEALLGVLKRKAEAEREVKS